jgi:hypothetical protein
MKECGRATQSSRASIIVDALSITDQHMDYGRMAGTGMYGSLHYNLPHLLQVLRGQVQCSIGLQSLAIERSWAVP